MNPYFIGLAALIAFGAGWEGNGWRLDAKYQAEAKTQLTVNAQALAALTAERDVLSGKLTAANDDSLKKLKEAQHETNRLRTATTGDVGLRVAAVCPAPGTPPKATGYASVDSGTGAELAPTARSAYFDLRDGIDRASAQLSACQGELRLRQDIPAPPESP